MARHFSDPIPAPKLRTYSPHILMSPSPMAPNPIPVFQIPTKFSCRPPNSFNPVCFGPRWPPCLPSVHSPIGKRCGWRLARREGNTAVVIFSWLFWGCFFNIDSGLFEVWDPYNQRRAELSLNLLLDLLNMVAYDLENELLRF